MQFLDFNIIADYIQNKVEMVTYDLQERGELVADELNNKAYKFAFYVNKGDYHEAVVEANAAKNRNRPVIPVLISNEGGVQDNSNSIEIYLQKIQFEVYGWCDRVDPMKDQWSDVELILGSLCADLKGFTDEIAGHTVKFDVSDYPEFEELDNKHFVAVVNMNMHIMFNAHLSNMDKIVINGVEIPYLNFSESYTTELVPNNVRTEMVKFMPNVSMYQITLSGLYVTNNSVVNLMVNGCTTGELFNQVFTVGIVRNGITIKEREMYIKAFQNVRNFGSLVAYNASFYPSFSTTGGN